MLKQEILEKLVCFSEEEIDCLNGINRVDKSIYTNETSNIIDGYKIFLENQDIAVRKHTRFCQYPMHRHNYIELIYVYGGQMTHCIGGESITLHEGEILLLNQNIWHSIDYCNENDIIFNFIIKPEFLEFMSSMMEQKNEVFNFIYDVLYSFQNQSEYMIFRTKDDQAIKSQVEAIITCIYEKNRYHLELKLQVGLLLAMLMERSDKINVYSELEEDCFLMSFTMMYIKNNYKNCTLKQIAKEMNIPNYTLSKIIKKMTGLTFKQLLQEERLLIAKQFLENTEMAIFQIIEEIGYENSTYFYKIFKDKYLMTPNEFRDYISSN